MASDTDSEQQELGNIQPGSSTNEHTAKKSKSDVTCFDSDEDEDADMAAFKAFADDSE